MTTHFTSRDLIHLLLGLLMGFALGLVVLVASMGGAQAQTPAPTIGYPEPTGQPWPNPVGAAPVEMTLTYSSACVDDKTVTYTETFVNALVRMQTIGYLEAIIAEKKPKPPAGMKVGVVTGKAFDTGQCPGTVYLSGWVVERAVRIDITIDGAAPVSVVPTVTMAGYPKVWKWCLPEKWQDGKEHKLYARAVGSGNMLIGPLDNATALSRWTFKVP